MPSLHTQIPNYEIHRPLLHIQVIGYYNHMTTLDKNINWMTLVHLLSVFFCIH